MVLPSGPLRESFNEINNCDPKYESVLKDNWYKVGEVIKR